MVKTPPAPPFKMAQSEFLLQLLVITLNNPAVFGKTDEFSQSHICRQGGKPVFGRFTLTFRPFDQRPFLRMWFRAPVIAMGRTHTQGGKARCEILFDAGTPGNGLKSPLCKLGAAVPESD
jgi:hypothetical protein